MAIPTRSKKKKDEEENNQGKWKQLTPKIN